MSDQQGGVRLDKWLWAARFFKTRSLAADAVDGGKVHLNGARAKPAKDVKLGYELSIRKGPYEHVVVVTGLSDKRGPAKQAALLYEERPDSIARREALREQLSLVAPMATDGRPSKKDRRQISAFKRGE